MDDERIRTIMDIFGIDKSGEGRTYFYLGLPSVVKRSRRHIFSHIKKWVSDCIRG